MSEGAVAAAGEPEKKSRFTLPSAYTILFALIVLAAIATWIIPAGIYNLNAAGEPVPGTYHEVASHPARILVDSSTAAARIPNAIQPHCVLVSASSLLFAAAAAAAAAAAGLRPEVVVPATVVVTGAGAATVAVWVRT
jgi:hypothetical protein